MFVTVLSLSPVCFHTNMCVCDSAWLTDEEDPVIDKLNQRLSDVTGLDMATAESLQVIPGQELCPIPFFPYEKKTI